MPVVQRRPTNRWRISATIGSLETGATEAAALRDRRDQIVSELSTLVDVSVNENPEGLYDVFVGSTPVVLGTRNRGVDVERETVDGVTSVSIRLKDNRAPLPVQSGSIGGLLQSRDGAIDATVEKLDTLASNLIFEVNKIHSTGRNADRLGATSATLPIAGPDRLLPINDPNNAAFANLPFAAQNGSFTIEVYNADTQTSNTVQIPVDLDGLDASNLPGVGDDTTPEDIRAALDAIPGMQTGDPDRIPLNSTCPPTTSRGPSSSSSSGVTTNSRSTRKLLPDSCVSDACSTSAWRLRSPDPTPNSKSASKPSAARARCATSRQC